MKSSVTRFSYDFPVALSKISPKVGSVDAWRASVLLEGLAPGEHRWSVQFD